MQIRTLRTALDDLNAGREFYNTQSYGVGEYFLDTLFLEIDSLVLHAGIHPIRFGFYRMLSRRFPYAIYYKVSEDEVVVWHVLDCREGPLKRDKALL